MKFVVISGSPKGEKSVTLQYCNYIKKYFRSHDFQVFHIGRNINRVEKDELLFNEIIEAVSASDGVIWCFPVFFLLVPYQLKRFIELVNEKNASGSFKNKFSTVISTSVHYFDNTAHYYIQAVSEDLEMNFVEGYSAETSDLLRDREGEKLLKFAKFFFHCCETKIQSDRRFPVKRSVPVYNPVGLKETEKKGKKRALLLTDSYEEDNNLNRMIDAFINRFPNSVEVIDINKINIRGGCLSCYRCGWDGNCSYKDDFVDFYNEKVQKAEILIFCSEIKDRYLSSKWKQFFDRSFFNGHRPAMKNRQIGFIISGPLKDNFHIRLIIEALWETGGDNLVGFVSDDYEDPALISKSIDDIAESLMWKAQEGYFVPSMFLGVGGHMIFRDLVYRMKWFFREDHNYYEQKGLYDYPQNDFKIVMQNFVMNMLVCIPAFRKMLYKTSWDEVLKPYKKLVE